MTDLLADARKELAAAEADRESVRARHREELVPYEERIRMLKRAVRALEGVKPKQRSAATQAGPAALAKVREALISGPLPQAQITKLSGLNDGTVSNAVRALLESGEIEDTGRFERGSRIFRLRHSAKVA